MRGGGGGGAGVRGGITLSYFLAEHARASGTSVKHSKKSGPLFEK